MSVAFERGAPSDNGWWLLAKSGDKVRLGAFIPLDQRTHDPKLTVFWRGHVARDQLRQFIGWTERLFRAHGRGDVQGTLIAFGPTRIPIGPVHEGLSSHLAPGADASNFDAYRAEFRGRAGKMALWANVTEPEPRQLEDGGENIGISVNLELFNGPARQLIAAAIHGTQDLSRETALELLGEISAAVTRRKESAGTEGGRSAAL